MSFVCVMAMKPPAMKMTIRTRSGADGARQMRSRRSNQHGIDERQIELVRRRLDRGRSPPRKIASHSSRGAISPIG